MNDLIFDQNGNILENVDLSKGKLIFTCEIKESAEPIDNVKKFAWDSTDYIEKQIYVPYTAEEIQSMKNKTLSDHQKVLDIYKEYELAKSNMEAKPYIMSNTPNVIQEAYYNVLKSLIGKNDQNILFDIFKVFFETGRINKTQCQDLLDLINR